MSSVKESIIYRISELEKKIEELGVEANDLSKQAARKNASIEVLSRELKVLLKTKKELEEM